MNIQKNTPKLAALSSQARFPKGDFCSAKVLLLGSIPQLRKPPLGGWG